MAACCADGIYLSVENAELTGSLILKPGVGRSEYYSHACLSRRLPGIIIIKEICKGPALRLKALNKRSITHIMYIEMENVISNLKEKGKITRNVDSNRGSSLVLLSTFLVCSP